jgi:peroxiredoxin
MKVAVFLIIFSFLSISVFAQNEFDAKTLSGDKISLTELTKRGPVLVNFWATWCQPCKAEIKHLKNIYEKYDSLGLTIIGVNQDSPKSLSKVKSFVSSYELKYPIVLDPNAQIFQKFNGQVMPYSVLFDKNQEIVYRHAGYLPGDEVELEEEVVKLLNKE